MTDIVGDAATVVTAVAPIAALAVGMVLLGIVWDTVAGWMRNVGGEAPGAGGGAGRAHAIRVGGGPGLRGAGALVGPGWSPSGAVETPGEESGDSDSAVSADDVPVDDAPAVEVPYVAGLETPPQHVIQARNWVREEKRNARIASRSRWI